MVAMVTQGEGGAAMVCGWVALAVTDWGLARRVAAFRSLVAKGAASRDSGYAAIDAMVGLMIFSLAIILSMTALQQARRTTAAALEVRQAQTLLSALLERGPRSWDRTTGEMGGFSWQLQTTPTGSERPVVVCRRAALVISIASGRNYAAATQETCPPSGPAT